MNKSKLGALSILTTLAMMNNDAYNLEPTIASEPFAPKFGAPNEKAPTGKKGKKYGYSKRKAT